MSPKNVHEMSPKKCPRKVTQKGDISWTKLSTRCHQKCPRNVTPFVHEMSPIMSTKCLPPEKTSWTVAYKNEWVYQTLCEWFEGQHIVRHPCIAGKPPNDKNLLQLNADVPWITLILCSAPYCMVSFLQWGANFIKYVQRNPEVSSIKSFVGIQLKRNWLNACHVRFPAM